MRDRLLAKDFEEPLRYWPYHRLAVDAYCLQHSAYIASATSFAAHIGGLCIALEFDNSEQLHRRLLKWLNASGRALVKPPVPEARGTLTIAHVSGLSDPSTYGSRVHEWARAVWDAYLPCQALTREWVQYAVHHQ
jgi:hypothetical protein